ncbi:conserved hypothetical protein [Altererythrobacter sp. B11]|uniref:YdcH family protein n=1 Tax=Altererythrobacter sp. B11 TaxID=2060312 RepID=UPI000DC6E7C6|nr:DUF465 domain-containing protein [Altererythrobacter sp. B11]BBC72576.1 conserved hypothetical protein [Altererythrobacter sp. B11]
MPHTPHELADEFPQDADVLHQLKTGSAHFATLSDRYHTVNNAIHRAEIEVEPVSDDRLEELKKERLAYLDELRELIAAHRAEQG